MPIFTGSATALVTPFKNDKIDYPAFEKFLEFQIANGTQALLVCGTTGEPSTLTIVEEQEAIKFAMEVVKHRVPVIAGTGANCTRDAVQTSLLAEKSKVDGLLLVTPYYNKCTQKGLIEHYTAIADAVHTPIIMYNVPGRTGVNINPATALTLSSHKNIVAIKEASGNISQISEVAELTHGKLDLYSGDDGIILPVMSLGGIGVISVASNAIPKTISQLTSACLSGDYALARELQFKINSFVKACFVEVNPIPIKTCMSLMGMMTCEMRLPLCQMEDSNLKFLKSEMYKLGLLT